jgi:hypothetical protein
MNLTELIATLDNIDDQSIIFLEGKREFDSDVTVLSSGLAHDMVDKRAYHYLIEVFLAKEFIRDWIGQLNYSPSHQEIAKRLYDYAIKDA